MVSESFAELVHIPVDSVTLEGMLIIPPGRSVWWYLRMGAVAAATAPETRL
jgi:hypothetical protein